MAVNNANITASSPAAGLTNSNQAKYTFLPSTSIASANAVKTEFSIEQSGTNVTLDADGIVVRIRFTMYHCDSISSICIVLVLIINGNNINLIHHIDSTALSLIR